MRFVFSLSFPLSPFVLGIQKKFLMFLIIRKILNQIRKLSGFFSFICFPSLKVNNKKKKKSGEKQHQQQKQQNYLT